MSDDVRYCTFHLGELFLGISVTTVQEVLRSPDRTRVPLVPAVVDGLINLRGDIVTTIDLRQRLGLAPRADGGGSLDVVVRHGDGVVSLLVDEIGDVFDADGVALEPLPPTLRGVVRRVVTGMHQVGDRLLLVLDTDALLDLDDLTRPTAAAT